MTTSFRLHRRLLYLVLKQSEWSNSCADPEIPSGDPELILLVIDVFQRAVQTFLEKQLDPS